MIRKLAIGLAAVTAAALLLPQAANAIDTVPPTTTAAVPTECFFTPEFTGPARVTHSAERTTFVEMPDCDMIDGICVILPVTGPSRTVHGITGTLPADPCEGVDDACVIVTSFPDDVGPARVVHGRPQPVILVGWPVEIPQPCQDVLSAVAIPTTGSDSGSTLWLASGFLLAGVVLVFGVRRVAAR